MLLGDPRTNDQCEMKVVQISNRGRDIGQTQVYQDVTRLLGCDCEIRTGGEGNREQVNGDLAFKILVVVRGDNKSPKPPAQSNMNNAFPVTGTFNREQSSDQGIGACAGPMQLPDAIMTGKSPGSSPEKVLGILVTPLVEPSPEG
ncbi:MAG TPA: hypothetical protein VMG10_34455 [Gemmataceae bacterium]|nr:hypothetical protein [Gemmataceae bacterium]